MLDYLNPQNKLSNGLGRTFHFVERCTMCPTLKMSVHPFLMNKTESLGYISIEFFRIEIYGIYRIYRICGILYLVILKMKITDNSILQIL